MLLIVYMVLMVMAVFCFGMAIIMAVDALTVHPRFRAKILRRAMDKVHKAGDSEAAAREDVTNSLFLAALAAVLFVCATIALGSW